LPPKGLKLLSWLALQEYINAIAMALVTCGNSLEGSSGQRLQVR
jgi:hypothetical protein